jgi:hypothetical protein
MPLHRWIQNEVSMPDVTMPGGGGILKKYKSMPDGTNAEVVYVGANAGGNYIAEVTVPSGLGTAQSMAALFGGTIPAGTEKIVIWNRGAGLLTLTLGSTATAITGIPIPVNGWAEVPKAALNTASIIQAVIGGALYAVAYG